MPDPLMECSESESECRMQNPALLGRDVRLKTPRGRFRLSTALAKLRNHLMRGFSKLQVLDAPALAQSAGSLSAIESLA